MSIRLRTKISYDILIMQSIILVVLLENELCRIFRINSGLLKLSVLAVICISIVLVALSRNRNKCMKCSEIYLVKYLTVIALFLGVQLFYTILCYSRQSITGFLQVAQSYLWILIVIPISYVCGSRIGMQKLLNILKYVVVASLLLMLINAIYYNAMGYELLNVASYKTFVYRAGRLRLWDLSSMEALVAIWCFYEILTTRHARKRNIVLLIIIFAAMFYVEQTRMMYMGLFVVMTVMYLLKKTTTRKEIYFKGILVLMAVVITSGSGIMEATLDSFSIEGQYGSSTSIRIDEIQYAFDIILKHPINGMGLMPTTVRDFYINYTGRGKFGYTDIGIIGQFAQVGVWTVFLYILPMIRFGTAIWRLRNRANVHFIFIAGLYTFLLLSSGTLLVLNQPRILMWPFCIGIFEYCSYCGRNNIVAR